MKPRLIHIYRTAFKYFVFRILNAEHDAAAADHCGRCPAVLPGFVQFHFCFDARVLCVNVVQET